MNEQVTDTILMIRPVRFGFNPQTAANNAFQSREGAGQGDAIQQAAQSEFDAFVEKLRAAGVRVLVFSDRPDAPQPDSIFPNNWFSTHKEGLFLLYPMFAPNRRAERRLDVPRALREEHGLDVRWLVDLSPNEILEQYLEGTGSMVIDRPGRVAYACLSARTHPELIRRFADQFGYSLCLFDATDQSGQAVYHTNVVMHIGSRLAVICLDAVAPDQRETVRRQLEQGGRDVLPISLDQMNHFAGNMLELRGAGGQHFTVMSQQALDALSAEQRGAIEAHTPILASPLDTIERFGGGSARCMMAEIFLSKG